MFALHEAAEAGQIRKVRRLLQNQELEINSADGYGNMALHYAALLGDRRVVAALIYGGVNVSALDCNDRTPLSHAVEGTRSEVIPLLMKCDIGLKDKLGFTVLDYAKLGADKVMDDPTFIRRRNYMYSTILVGMQLYHADKVDLIDNFCDFLSKMDEENKVCIVNNMGRVIDLGNQSIETILSCISLKSLQCSALIKCIRSSVEVPERLYKLSDSYHFSYDVRGNKILVSGSFYDYFASKISPLKDNDQLFIQ